ncbi:RNA polymerase sigma factor [Spongiactinospora rosea]|uniref:RNA polymerase sigma factor n=1 Tax=Spongiactinospora rosea TaxID=2248750 RepID=A0A366LT24_9ACTN|nr:sigma-70 family RNA polymerase sigma factor [Spongiactinospora rosea]RBQ16907.1 RNA polymerase sigma factor [Spongiactinospora rosea]
MSMLEALRAGDERAFIELVREHQPAMLRLATMYSPSRAVAEEVVQETWLAVLNGLAGFEGRAALRTWITRILLNIARRRAGLEARAVPYSSLGPTLDPARFHGEGPYAGHWISIPDDWSAVPEAHLASAEVRDLVRRVVNGLPPRQREVITLRDIEGWKADEVSDLLEITQINQRVLLHRARAVVRRALEIYLERRNA